MDSLQQLKDSIIWDFHLKDEFINRQEGNGFVIDVYQGMPRLALYKMKKHHSESALLQQQPPQELLESSLEEQGLVGAKDNLYNITPSVRLWIEANILKSG